MLLLFSYNKLLKKQMLFLFSYNINPKIMGAVTWAPLNPYIKTLIIGKKEIIKQVYKKN